MAGEPIRVGEVSEFPEGEGVRVDVEGFPVPVAVFRVDGTFHAVTDRCPHKGAPLSRAGTTPEREGVGATRGRLDPEAGTVSCPWHGMTFDLETGDCPAASYRVGAFEVTVEDDTVYLAR